MLQETAARLAGIAGAAAPIVVCNEAHRFTVAEQIARAGDRSLRHPARARRPQYRAGGRARGACRRSKHRSGRDPDRRAGRSRDSRCAQLSSRRPRWPRRLAQQRQARDLRHRGARAGNRLRLYPPRRGRGSRLSGGAIHRKAAARCRAAVRRLRRLLLEQRHVRVQGEPLSGGARRIRAGHSRGVHGGLSRRPRRIWISCASTRRHSRNAAASRSITR